MKKLIHGVVDFHEKLRPDYQKTFKDLALGQRPDSLFIACSDSRVAPNVFASTDPGDLFVVRNVGNLVPPCCGQPSSPKNDNDRFEANTVAAALEFSLTQLPVKDIIVCGHSECGGVAALFNGRDRLEAPHLKHWLRHGESSVHSQNASAYSKVGRELSPVNRLSQINVLEQLKNLLSYDEVARRVSEKKLRLHAWWFDIGNAEVDFYDEDSGQFIVLNRENAEKIRL